MGSEALAGFLQAVQEVKKLRQGDPTPTGGAPDDPELTRVVGRASVVLLSSHFERYIYAVNEEAVRRVNEAGARGGQLSESIRLLHSREAVDLMIETGWERRAAKLREFMATDAWLWHGDSVGQLDHKRLLGWMKAPTPKNLLRYYRYWGNTDIFTAITRSVNTRDDLVLKLDELVTKRNNIAHGDRTTEATSTDIVSYRDAALRFCDRADRQISRAVAKALDVARPW